MTKLHMKQRMNFLRDNIKNRKIYRAMRRKSRRDWYVDISQLDPDTQFKFDIDDSSGRNVFYVDGKVVANMTFAETAMFYRFLKRCLYR